MICQQNKNDDTLHRQVDLKQQIYNCEGHIQTHTGIHPCQCTFCQKTFAREHQCDQHVLTHMAEKPYQCTFCPKKFTLKQNCVQHIQTHTGEKPYQCNFCPKKFARKYSCDLHIRNHTGEKPYQCIFCPKKFSAKSNCDVHIRTHTGDKPFQCTICLKKFKAKQSLKRHEQKYKPVTNSVLPSKEAETIKINTTKSVGETFVDKRSEYLTCPKCGIEFVYEFELELHLEFYQHPSKNNDEASTPSSSLNLGGTSDEGLWGAL